MRILITGNCGFIGAHLFRKLTEEGHSVIGIDNLSHPSGLVVPFSYADVREIGELEKYFQNIDICFHLAAQISVDRSIEFPKETIDVNILGAQNVLELARKYNVKVVFASTSEIYGSSQSEFMDEKHPLDPQSPYGASKLAADRLCLAYHKTFGTDVVVVRNFNVFGDYQSDDSYGGVISIFTKAALNNEPLKIFGSGKQERDYMHIGDALQAYELAMGLESGTVINFGTGKTIQIMDLADKIIELSGGMSQILNVSPRQGEVQRLCADITKAKKHGFYPKTDFYKNLGDYIQWQIRQKK